MVESCCESGDQARLCSRLDVVPCRVVERGECLALMAIGELLCECLPQPVLLAKLSI